MLGELIKANPINHSTLWSIHTSGLQEIVAAAIALKQPAKSLSSNTEQTVENVQTSTHRSKPKIQRIYRFFESSVYDSFEPVQSLIRILRAALSTPLFLATPPSKTGIQANFDVGRSSTTPRSLSTSHVRVARVSLAHSHAPPTQLDRLDRSKLEKKSRKICDPAKASRPINRLPAAARQLFSQKRSSSV